MNIAYIDMQNIHQSTKEMWRLIDRELLYWYLQTKYDIKEIFVFMWFIQKYTHIYNQLRLIGYKIIFKEVLVRNDWTIKWDVDIDIAIQAMHHLYGKKVTKAFLITWDADYNTLINERKSKWIFWKLLVPSNEKTLYILRKAAWWNLQTLKEIKHIIQKKQKE